MVKFVFRRVNPSVRIPSAAIVFHDGPRRMGVLDDHHTIHYRNVELGRDFGDEIEVLGGPRPGKTVVVHSGDYVPEDTILDAVPLAK